MKLNVPLYQTVVGKHSLSSDYFAVMECSSSLQVLVVIQPPIARSKHVTSYIPWSGFNLEND